MAQTQTSSEASARFEKALRLFAELGLSAERSVNHCCAPALPRSCARDFPTCPLRVQVPVEPRAARPPRCPTNLEPRERGGQGAVCRASLAQRVLERTAAAIASACLAINSPRRASDSADLSEGISFQYVPLIQCSFPHADPGARRNFTRRNGWLELTLSTARPRHGPALWRAGAAY